MAIGLSRYIGFAAAAYGATCAGWAMLACLWWGARRFGPAASWDAQLRKRSFRILLASLGMGVVVWITARALEPVLQMDRSALARFGCDFIGGGGQLRFGWSSSWRL